MAVRTRVMNLVITGTSAPAVAALTSVRAAAHQTLTPFQKLGAVSTGVFAAVAAGAGIYAAKSVKAFRDFDAAMTKSIAIMDDVSPRMRKRLEETAFAIAKSTTFSAKEAAEAFYFLASAGYEVEDSIKVLPPIARFAQAGMFDLDKATQLLASSQAALGLRIKNDAVANMKEMIRISDVLVKADAESNASVQEFATALTTKAAGAMRTMNVELEEGVAVLATFADRGVRGAKAGTQLAIVLRDIPRAAVRNQEEFKKWGIEIFDSRGNLKNLADVVDEFTSALGPMNDGQRAAVLEQLGMTRSVGDIIRVLINGGDSIRTYEALLRQAGGTTERVAKKQLVSFESQLKLLRNEFDITAIRFGEPIAFWMAETLIPWVRETALPTLHSLGEWFISDFAPVLATIGDILADVVMPPLEAFLWVLTTIPGADNVFAWVAAFLLIGSSVAFISTKVPLLAASLSLLAHELSVVFLGTLLWAGGASTLGGALAYIYTQSKLLKIVLFPFTAIFQAISIAVATWGAATVGVVAAVVVAVAALGYVVYRNWGTVKKWLMSFGSWLVDTFGPIWDTVYRVVKGAVLAIADAVWGMIQAIPGAVSTIVSVVWTILQGIGGAIVWVVSNVVSVAGSIASGVWTVLKTVAGAISSGVGALMRALAPVGRFFLSVFGAVWNWLSQTFGPGIAKIWATLQEELEKTGLEIGPTVGAISHVFAQLWGVLRVVVGWVIKNIPKVGEAIGWVFTHLGPIFSWIVTNAAKLLGGISNAIDQFVTYAAANIWAILQGVGRALAGLFGPVVRFLAPVGRAFMALVDVFGAVSEAMRKFVVDVAVKLAPIWGAAWNYIEAVAMAAVTVFKAFIGPVILFVWRILRTVADWLRSVFVVAWRVVQATVVAVWDMIVAAIVTAIRVTFAVIRLFMAFIQGDVSGIWQALRDVVVAVWSGLVSFVGAGVRLIWSIMQTGWYAIQAIVTTAVRIIGSIILLLWDTVIGPVFRAIQSIITTVVVPVFQFLWKVAQTVFDAIGVVISWWWTNVVQPVWTAVVWMIQTVLIPIFNALWVFLKGAWEGIGLLISDVWNGVIQPIWNAIVWVIQTILIPTFQALWSFLQMAWAAIGAIIQFAWTAVIQPIWNALIWMINTVLIPTFSTLWNVINYLWALIGGAISIAWNNVIKPVWEGIISFIDNTLLPKFTIVKDWILGIWNAVADGMSAIWDTIKSMVASGVNRVIDFINILINGVNGITGLINKVAPGDDIGKIGLIPKIGQGGGTTEQWDRGRGKGRGVLAPNRNPFIHPAGSGVLAMARGGIPPANIRETGPFMTNGVRAIVGEGRPQYPEFVIPTDPRFRDSALSLWQNAGAKLFAAGGVMPRGPGIAGLYDPLASKVERILQEGNGQVSVVSGWRSTAKQAALYRDYVNGVPGQAKAAPPGRSNHERGAAVDFGGNVRVWQALAAKHGLSFPVRGEDWHAEDPSMTGRGGLLGSAMNIIYSNLAGHMAPIVWNVRAGLRALGSPGPLTGAGHYLAAGLLDAMKSLDDYANAQYAAAGMTQAPGMSASYSGGGAERWRTTALQALNLAGAPGTWIGSLLRRMQQESGGNPNAINNWDSNARKGTPSKGLMQVIDPTFRAYAGALIGRGVFDPLANIFAAIKYTIARYGSGPAGWDRRGGYENGAWRTALGVPVHDDELVMPKRAAGAFRNLLETGNVNGGGDTIINVQPGAVVIQVPPDDMDARRAARAGAKEFMQTIAERRVAVDARTS